MKSELIPTNGDPPIPITKDLTLIGRREYCDVRIEHHSLSRRHCVLVRTDGLMMVRDLATTNGTKVNGQRVMWAALLPNDRLTLGKYKLRVYLGPDDAPSPSELGPDSALAFPPAPPPTSPSGEYGALHRDPSPLELPVLPIVADEAEEVIDLDDLDEVLDLDEAIVVDDDDDDEGPVGDLPFLIDLD